MQFTVIKEPAYMLATLHRTDCIAIIGLRPSFKESDKGWVAHESPEAAQEYADKAGFKLRTCSLCNPKIGASLDEHYGERSIWDGIANVEKSFRLPEGFYNSLYEEDDWSFIVKLHALFEGAITDLVSVALGDEKLRDIVSWLELSNKRTGKMAIVSALDLLDTPYRTWISKLSEFRNEYAHNVSNISMPLNKHADKPGKSEALAKAFCLGHEKVEFDDRKLENIEYVREDLKRVIWMTGALCLAVINVKTDQTREKSDLRKVLLYKKGRLAGMEEILTNLKGSSALPE